MVQILLHFTDVTLFYHEYYIFGNYFYHSIKGPFIIYTLGGGGILMSYTKILKPPPLDDLNVEDPPIKY